MASRAACTQRHVQIAESLNLGCRQAHRDDFTPDTVRGNQTYFEGLLGGGSGHPAQWLSVHRREEEEVKKKKERMRKGKPRKRMQLLH